MAVERRLWLDSIVKLLGTHEAIEPIEGARDFTRLKVIVRQHTPDAVVLALPLQDMDDPVQLLELRQSQPDLAFAIIADSEAQIRSLQFLLAYAPVAFVAGDLQGADLATALYAVKAGFTVTSRQFVPALLGNPATAGRRKGSLPALSDREKIVLQGAAEGASDAMIAHRLGLSARTVQTHLNQARQKLHATDRTHAVALALSLGIIAPPSSDGLPKEFSVL